MPLGVTINCHSSRHGEVVIKENEYKITKEKVTEEEVELAADMSNIKKISLPITVDQIKELHAGDIVSLSGTLHTGRDAAHKRIKQALENGEEIPFDMEGQGIYYVGPSPSRPGNPIGSCGPTTSYRMDSFSETILKEGIRIMIGKGPRGQETKDLMQEYPSVYLANIGGAAAITASSIKSCEIIAYYDLGPEAVRKLEVEGLICFVAVDSYGKDLYEEATKKLTKQKMN